MLQMEGIMPWGYKAWYEKGVGGRASTKEIGTTEEVKNRNVTDWKDRKPREVTYEKWGESHENLFLVC